MFRLVELFLPERLRTGASGLAPAVMVGAVLLLGGCTTAPEPPPEPTPVAPSLPPPSPVVDTPPPKPAPKPAPAPVEPPPVVVAPEPEPNPAEEAARALAVILSGQLGLEEDVITVATATESVWPNACLGFPAEGEICAEVLTPGFAISLETTGQLYSFRTDETLDRIRLVAAPLPDIGEPLVVWKDTRSSFATATVGTQAMAVGLRGSPQMSIPIDSTDPESAIAILIARFAPFQAVTEAGEVDFKGRGTEEAGPVEQRMVAEWVRGFYEAIWIEGDPDTTPAVLSWERTGGIAGFCDFVLVTAGGQVLISDCRGESTHDLALTWLDRRQLSELYEWMDTIESFESDQTDPVGQDALTVSITLKGQGWKKVSPEDIAAMHRMASDLYLQGYEQANGS